VRCFPPSSNSHQEIFLCVIHEDTWYPGLRSGGRLGNPFSLDSSVNRAFSNFCPYCISEPETKIPSTIPSSSSASSLGIRTCSNLLLSVSSIRRALSGWKVNLDAPKPKNNVELNVSGEHIIVCVPTLGRFVLMEMRFSFVITAFFKKNRMIWYCFCFVVNFYLRFLKWICFTACNEISGISNEL